MKRRAPHERVEHFRNRDGVALGALRERIATWAIDAADALRDADPQMPDGVVDRAADVWEANIVIGDAAGSEWSALLRAAAVVFVHRVENGSERGHCVVPYPRRSSIRSNASSISSQR